MAFLELNHYTMEPRYNEPLYNKDFGITNNIFKPSNREMYVKEPDETNPEFINETADAILWRKIETLRYARFFIKSPAKIFLPRKVHQRKGPDR